MCNSFSIKKNQYFPYKALNVFYILYFYDSYSKRSKKKTSKKTSNTQI